MHPAQMSYANSPTARDQESSQQPKRRKASARTTINLSQRGDELLKHLATQALLPKIRAINHAVALLLSEPLERLQIPKEYALHPPNLHIQGTNISSSALLDLQRKAQTAKLSVLRPGHLIELFLAAHVDVNKRYSDEFLRRLRESMADPRSERNERSKRVRAEDDDGGREEEEEDDPVSNMMTMFSPQPSGPPPQARDNLEPAMLELLGFIESLFDLPLYPDDGPNLSTLANRRGYREALQALHRLQLRSGSQPSATIGKMLFMHLTGGYAISQHPEAAQRHLQKASLVPLLLQQTKELNLRGNLIGPTGTGMLNEGLRNNAVVNNIDLSLNLIGDSGAEHLADTLAANGAISTLNLASNAIKDSGAEALARGLASNASLQNLDLRANAIGDRGAEALARALRMNHSLTSLCLWNNSITDSGGMALASAIATSESLQHLNISFNLMGEQAAVAFAAALHQNRSLKSVDLRNNAWGEHGRKMLTSLPQREDLTVFLEDSCREARHDVMVPADTFLVAAKQLQLLHGPPQPSSSCAVAAAAASSSSMQMMQQHMLQHTAAHHLHHQQHHKVHIHNGLNHQPMNPFATLPPILPPVQGAAE